MVSNSHRTTIYLDPALQRALKLKAIETNRSMSELVNEALRAVLSEDFDDLRALEDRTGEPSRPFRDFLAELKADGLL